MPIAYIELSEVENFPNKSTRKQKLFEVIKQNESIHRNTQIWKLKSLQSERVLRTESIFEII